MDILSYGRDVKLPSGSIGQPGGCFLNCRYFAEKMISGIGAHRRFASVSTKIGIGKERFRSSRVDSGKLKFLVVDAARAYVWMT